MTRTNGRPRLRRPPKADAAIYDGLAQRFRAGELYSFSYDHDGQFWTTFATEHDFDATERNGRYRCSCAPECGFGPTDWLDRGELVKWLGLDDATKVTRKRHAKTAADGNGGSELVAALEAAYGAIRRHHPELPDVVMITGSGMDSYGLRWGHFARDRWIDALNEGRRPEMFVGGERLACGAELTFQTMLHESAHAIACVRGVQDCSRQNRYHNRRFLELAREVGLEYPHGAPDATIGYSAVELTDAARKRYSTAVGRLERAVRLHLDKPPSDTQDEDHGDARRTWRPRQGRQQAHSRHGRRVARQSRLWMFSHRARVTLNSRRWRDHLRPVRKGVRSMSRDVTQGSQQQVARITEREYDRSRHHGYAGPLSELLLGSTKRQYRGLGATH